MLLLTIVIAGLLTGVGLSAWVEARVGRIERASREPTFPGVEPEAIR